MKKIILLTAMLFCLCACESTDPPKPSATPENAVTIALSENTGEFENMNVYEDCEHDITKSGDENEKISLLTSAKKDSDGHFMWDDIREWVLLVENEQGIYPLYNAKNHATLSMNVSEHYLENGETEDVIRLTISSSAGYEIREYTFSDGVFAEKIAYDTGAINELSINKYY